MSHRLRMAAALWATLALVLCACAKGDRTPEGAVRLFLQAVHAGSTDRIFDMLAPETQHRLEKMAKLASAQTGGKQSFKAHDLIVAGNSIPVHRSGEISLIRRDGDRASVKIFSHDRKRNEVFNLMLVDSRWRIRLPERMARESLGR